MLEGVVGRPSDTRGWPYMASKGLISRGFQRRTQERRRAIGNSLIHSIWSS
jgi:hypothetical protein